MLGWLKNLFAGGPSAPAESDEGVEYKGYLIRPAPYPDRGGYQTAGVIEREIDGRLCSHRFVRAEVHPAREDAAAFALSKGRQIVDEQGDRIFEERTPR